MHPFCRCSDYPYIPNSRKGTRAARDENGRSITVPDDMTYQEWYGKYVDKSGESGIIKAEPASKYLNFSEQLYKNALRVQPISNYEDIVIHGDKYSFEIHDKDGSPIDEYSPKELAEVLKEDPNYHGGNIRLISCEAGTEEAGAAQTLANLLGVDVMAPKDIVWAMPDGKMVIGPTVFDNTGIWKIFKPKGEVLNDSYWQS